MTDQEPCREAFEKWYRKEVPGKELVIVAGRYSWGSQMAMWEAYQDAWNQRSEGECVYQVRKGVTEDFEDCHEDTYRDFYEHPELRRILYTRPSPVAIGGLSDAKWFNLFARMYRTYEDANPADIRKDVANAARQWLADNAAPVVSDEMVERGLQACIADSDARLPRYKVVRAIIEAALQPKQGEGNVKD